MAWLGLCLKKKKYLQPINFFADPPRGAGRNFTFPNTVNHFFQKTGSATLQAKNVPSDQCPAALRVRQSNRNAMTSPHTFVWGREEALGVMPGTLALPGRRG